MDLGLTVSQTLKPGIVKSPLTLKILFLGLRVPKAHYTTGQQSMYRIKQQRRTCPG